MRTVRPIVAFGILASWLAWGQTREKARDGVPTGTPTTDATRPLAVLFAWNPIVDLSLAGLMAGEARLLQGAAASALHLADDPKTKEDADGRELDRHQGTWLATSFVRDGTGSPPEVVGSIRRVVVGDHVVWTRDGKSFAATTVELDPAQEPMTIDVIPDGGPSRGERVPGIYKLEGDTLTICMGEPGRGRPKEFKAVKGSGSTLMTFRRAKPR